MDHNKCDRIVVKCDGKHMLKLFAPFGLTFNEFPKLYIVRIDCNYVDQRYGKKNISIRRRRGDKRRD